jgi:hypothetical protein
MPRNPRLNIRKRCFAQSITSKTKTTKEYESSSSKQFQNYQEKIPFVRIGVADETSGIQFSSKNLRWYV